MRAGELRVMDGAIVPDVHQHTWVWFAVVQGGPVAAPPASATCSCGMSYGQWVSAEALG